MVTLDNLISHRFRGFSDHENSMQGLLAALDFGVLNLEFDIRIARCGTPVIYHDEYARDKSGKKHLLKDLIFSDFEKFGGQFAHMPSAEALFFEISRHKNNKAKILIDIKDPGFETEIHALIYLFKLQARSTIVAWLPEVLFTLHDKAPELKFCLSYWCKKPGPLIKAKHKVFVAKNNTVLRKDCRSILGQRSGWFIDGSVKGELRSFLTSICVPQNMIYRELVDDYHKDNIAVSTFSYVKWATINQHQSAMNVDLFFIDNKTVFEELA